MTIRRTLRMLRHLRARQVAHRLWYRLRLPWFASAPYDWFFLRPGGDELPARFPPLLWPGDGDNGRRMLDGAIRLVGRDHPFAVPVDWPAAQQPLLWRFTLHYFEWLGDLEATGEEAARHLARAAVAHWIEVHRRPDAVAWHPYPLSLRLFAWLRHAPFLLDGAEESFGQAFAAALRRQARHLARVVERDVGGNHILKNLKALIAAGNEGAMRELEDEVARQVLADGGHYERSPSYHLQVLGDLLEIRSSVESTPVWLDDAIRRMGRALALFRHGDGGLALFNDGEVAEASRIDAVARLAGEASPPVFALADSGYLRLAAGDAVVLMDAGPCCPDDLPAHAHADTLAFEFSAGPQRLIVNCGTYAYQDPDWRNRLRGTAAHSTVAIDGEDSAEVFATFRLGRRPLSVDGTLSEEDTGFTAKGSHDGYRHLGLVHRRHLTLEADGRRLWGEDRIDAAGTTPHTMTARFHVHPAVSVSVEREDSVRLVTPDGEEWLFFARGGAVRLEDSVFAPRFYEMRATRQIVVERGLKGDSSVLAWCFHRRDG